MHARQQTSQSSQHEHSPEDQDCTAVAIGRLMAGLVRAGHVWRWLRRAGERRFGAYSAAGAVGRRAGRRRIGRRVRRMDRQDPSQANSVGVCWVCWV
jgi:hypothetical protein